MKTCQEKNQFRSAKRNPFCFITSLLKQTVEKCKEKTYRDIFSFWFQVLRAGKILDEPMGKVLRLKLGIRFPVSAYLPDGKPCSGLSNTSKLFLEFLLFFQKREILTCVLVLCGFCTFSNSMSALVVR